MELLVIIVLTLINALFALSEIALVSVKRHNIEVKAEQGNKKAKIVLSLLDKPEHFLSSIQVGITLIGIIAGAYGATALVDNIEPIFRNFDFLMEYSREISYTIIIAIITYFTIVIGELIPKSIAINNPEKIALLTGPIINFFTHLSYPLVKVLSFSTKVVLKIIGIEENKERAQTGDELIYLLKAAGTNGVIEKEESLMHQNIFTFSQQKAKSLKTHRSEVEWININNDLKVIKEQIKNSSYSKFPACNGNIDEVVGIITAKDFFEHYDSITNLEDILKESIFVPETMNAVDILKLFKKKKEYLGIVVDEYGSFEGIVTLHDLVESIVGDLPDFDEDMEIHTREDGTFLVGGGLEISELNNFFNLELITENHENYITLAGFIIFFLGRIPTIGESFEYNAHKFEIIDMDGNKIDKVIITRYDKDQIAGT